LTLTLKVIFIELQS